jgi:hypothetical protein
LRAAYSRHNGQGERHCYEGKRAGIRHEIACESITGKKRRGYFQHIVSEGGKFRLPETSIARPTMPQKMARGNEVGRELFLTSM